MPNPTSPNPADTPISYSTRTDHTSSTWDVAGKVSCKDAMPLGARPTSTPIGLLLKDASGFQVMTTWYVPPVDGCTRGKSYVTVHQISAMGTATQRVGAVAADEPAMPPSSQTGNFIRLDWREVY